MATVITPEQKAELACAYASLILADGEIKVTADKLQTVIEAAGIKDVPSFWTKLFAKVLEKKDINELITNASSSVAPVPAAAAETPAEAAPADKGADKKKAPKEDKGAKEDKEAEGDFGFDLFG
eukprot:TRINITY_DN34401_c0_g1_i2.p1 TRINITY_DN34401_c0_g1~~TRINITY_DN34401_c0_g1_i2.p1  ORF type:complete len:124 (-),score=46.22 TRINITY_DN34401_c0_g1_i2:54-425(-)